MTFNRRGLLAGGLGLGALGVAATQSHAATTRRLAVSEHAPAAGMDISTFIATPSASDSGLLPNAEADQSSQLQAAIDRASALRIPLALAPGRYRVAGIRLRSNTVITGSLCTATLVLAKPGALLTAEAADGIELHHLRLEGAQLATGVDPGALIAFKGCNGLRLSNLDITGSGGRAIGLDGCSGRITGCRIDNIKDAAIFAIDSTSLDITANTISKCDDNGIQVWRRKAGEDGTIVAGNRISHIAATSGGSGQNGNGINVYRAAGVLVEANRITDCAYSAVRGNAASNLQILANSCQRIGEVALYAEFGFEGTVIANNLVDGAAAGISVTNFNEGGRLAVVQGNLIRNLTRREHEPVDKRGEGISVEADASVTGNTIENAPTAGIVIGWGRHMRECVANANLIRNAGVGIMISADGEAGACFVTGNMISASKDGAIRAMDKGKPLGPDLAREAVATSGRVVVVGNMAV